MTEPVDGWADLLHDAAEGDPGEQGEMEMGLCPCGRGYIGHEDHGEPA